MLNFSFKEQIPENFAEIRDQTSRAFSIVDRIGRIKRWLSQSFLTLGQIGRAAAIIEQSSSPKSSSAKDCQKFWNEINEIWKEMPLEVNLLKRLRFLNWSNRARSMCNHHLLSKFSGLERKFRPIQNLEIQKSRKERKKFKNFDEYFIQKRTFNLGSFEMQKRFISHTILWPSFGHVHRSF